MSEWITPKTDWTVRISRGTYLGDFFNYSDYNRIKNNVQYLYDMAKDIYSGVGYEDMGADKDVTEYAHADEINRIEYNLEQIANKVKWVDIGTRRTYYDNQEYIDFSELNRIESGCQTLYEYLYPTYNGRQRLAFKFGGDRYVIPTDPGLEAYPLVDAEGDDILTADGDQIYVVEKEH